MYNEFLFFYEKEPYKQFIWRYMGQTTAAKEYVFPLLRISNPQSINRLGHFFDAGFQIRQDAWRDT